MPEVIIPGPEGRLEGRYHHNTRRDAPLALLLHPDPRHGGTMNNRIIFNLFNSFARRGFSVLRFNFRGVGRSQGRYARGEGELADAAAALDWMQGANPDSRMTWVAGFSFGAWIGMQLLMRRPEIGAFVSIAPPANLYDFTFLAPCPSSGLIVHGDADDIVPKADITALVERLSRQKGIRIEHRNVAGANHLFQDRMDELMEAVESYIDARLGLELVPG